MVLNRGDRRAPATRAVARAAAVAKRGGPGGALGVERGALVVKGGSIEPSLQSNGGRRLGNFLKTFRKDGHAFRPRGDAAVAGFATTVGLAAAAGAASPQKAPRWSVLPEGAIDVYEGHLLQYRPHSQPHGEGALEVYAMPLHQTTEELRKSGEAILHHAWRNDAESKQNISNHIGLHLNGMNLRNGKKTSRCYNLARSARVDHWLIWERISSSGPPGMGIVGALLLRRQGAKDGKGAGHISIDYVSAQRSRRGKGWPMVLAAQAICHMEGIDVLWSAADLSQDGSWADRCAAQGPAAAPPPAARACGGALDRSAVAAHRRWGFVASSTGEWKAAGLELYDEQRCRVLYMKKVLWPSAEAWWPQALHGASLPCTSEQQRVPSSGFSPAPAAADFAPASPQMVALASQVPPPAARQVALAPSADVGDALPWRATMPPAQSWVAGAAGTPCLKAGAEEDKLKKEIDRCRKLQEIDRFLGELQEQEEGLQTPPPRQATDTVSEAPSMDDVAEAPFMQCSGALEFIEGRRRRSPKTPPRWRAACFRSIPME